MVYFPFRRVASLIHWLGELIQIRQVFRALSIQIELLSTLRILDVSCFIQSLHPRYQYYQQSCHGLSPWSVKESPPGHYVSCTWPVSCYLTKLTAGPISLILFCAHLCIFMSVWWSPRGCTEAYLKKTFHIIIHCCLLSKCVWCLKDYLTPGCIVWHGLLLLTLIYCLWSKLIPVNE